MEDRGADRSPKAANDADREKFVEMDRTVVQAEPHTLSSALAWERLYSEIQIAKQDSFTLKASRNQKGMKKRFGGFAWIPITEGICGAAVAQRDTIIIDDVASDPRYLACSLETKSEIVVPIRAGEEIVGEIDINSHSRGAFGREDRVFLEECAAIVGQFIAGRHG